MTWSETHRRWQALQEIEALANAGCEELPWNTQYAEIFGDRDGLAAALRYRWNLTRNTQLDTHLEETVLEQQRARLLERNAGVLRLLQRHETGVPAQRRPDEAGLPSAGTTYVDPDRISA